MDVIDFEGHQLDASSANVAIYKKVDKVSRCFKPRAASQNKFLEFSGSSIRYSKGPDIFELVPYALIDNGIKYSPRGNVVSISVHDGIKIRMTITSLGPRIKKSELENIFTKGARAEAAISTGLPGSGLGLPMAAKIVTMFSGEIYAQQSQNPVNIDGNEYFETTFTVNVPAII